MNAPQSKRFAKFRVARQSRQRLDCGGFSAAILSRQLVMAKLCDDGNQMQAKLPRRSAAKTDGMRPCSFRFTDF